MMGMGWRYGAGGMLAALVLGAGWPGTAAAQFALPILRSAIARQLAPSGALVPAVRRARPCRRRCAPSAMAPPSPGGVRAAAAGDAGTGQRRRPGLPLARAPGSARDMPADHQRPGLAGVSGTARHARRCSASSRRTAAPNPVDRAAARRLRGACGLRHGERGARRCTCGGERGKSSSCPAGGIKLEGRVGDVPIRGNQITFDIYKGSQFEPGDKLADRPRGHDRRRRHRARGRLSHRLQLRRHQRGGALRHPRPGRQAHRRHGEPPRRRHHCSSSSTRRAAKPAPTRSWSVLTPGGDVIKESIGAFPRVILAEGDYRAIARSDGRTLRAQFQGDHRGRRRGRGVCAVGTRGLVLSGPLQATIGVLLAAGVSEAAVAAARPFLRDETPGRQREVHGFTDSPGRAFLRPGAEELH